MGLFSAYYIRRAVDRATLRQTQELVEHADGPRKRTEPEAVGLAVVLTFVAVLFGTLLLLSLFFGVEELSSLGILSVLAGAFLCSAAVAAMLTGK